VIDTARMSVPTAMNSSNNLHGLLEEFLLASYRCIALLALPSIES
jgi:hypothetical protein